MDYSGLLSCSSFPHCSAQVVSTQIQTNNKNLVSCDLQITHPELNLSICIIVNHTRSLLSILTSIINVSFKIILYPILTYSLNKYISWAEGLVLAVTRCWCLSHKVWYLSPLWMMIIMMKTRRVEKTNMTLNPLQNGILFTKYIHTYFTYYIDRQRYGWQDGGKTTNNY